MTQLGQMLTAGRGDEGGGNGFSWELHGIIYFVPPFACSFSDVHVGINWASSPPNHPS